MSRIQTNIPAMNTLRQLGISSRMFARSVGRLSSGFRINRAADDAAGLGIANTLRADIRATRQAARNTEQGNSVLQVMEGGAQQLSGILERMKELAAQAASDSVNASARSSINNEFDQLSAEIDRIVDTTKFQGQKLMDGTFGSKSVTANAVNLLGSNAVHANTGYTVTTSQKGTVASLTAGDLTLVLVQDNTTLGSETIAVVTGLDGTVTIDGTDATLKAQAEGSYTIGYDSGADRFYFSSDGTFGNAEATVDASTYSVGDDIVVAGITLNGVATEDVTAAGAQTFGTVTIGQGFTATLSGGGASDSVQTLDANGSTQDLVFGNHGVSVKVDSAQNLVTASIGSNNKITIASTTTSSAQFLVSASGDYTTNDLVDLSAVNLSAATLGVTTAAIDLTTGSGAQTALSTIDSAILVLNNTFSDIGAAQNRMDFAFNNAQSMVENLSAAESVIRDTNMAEEITAMTKFQILQQAGIAMLAQANSAPQAVLALLR